MTTCRTKEPPRPRIVLCPRCRAPRAVVRPALATCGCYLAACRCAHGALALFYVEDKACRGGCVPSVVAWRAHLAPGR
jgi:hypothetical protein